MTQPRDIDTKVNVRPTEGLQVRKENGQIIPENGCEVILSKYYRNRIKDGDLEIIKTTIKKSAPTKNVTKTSKGTK